MCLKTLTQADEIFQVIMTGLKLLIHDLTFRLLSCMVISKHPEGLWDSKAVVSYSLHPSHNSFLGFLKYEMMLIQTYSPYFFVMYFKLFIPEVIFFMVTKVSKRVESVPY